MNVSLLRPRAGLMLALAALILLALFPVMGVPRNWILYLFLFFIYLAMANMWNLLAGYSGLISLCPAAFIGLAGYTMAVLTWFKVPYYYGVFLGAMASALFAVIVSVPVFRLKGIYFAIGTLVLPEILRYVFLLWKPVGGGIYGGGAGYTVRGVSGLPQSYLYWAGMAVGLLSFILLRQVLRSKLGRGLAAIRDNDSTAQSIGVNVFNLKLASFVLAAGVTGLAGAVLYIYQGYIEPGSAFGVRWLVIIMLSTVIGGIGIVEGPIAGTIVCVFLDFMLSRYAGISVLIQGVILVGIMLLAPRGIVGSLRKSPT